MTKILFLADINSPHTAKWALSLAAKGFEVGIFSLNKSTSTWFKGNSNIEYLSDGLGSDVSAKKEVRKISYLKAIPALRKIITSFQPDIVHAHYATSYGLLGSFSGFHPFVLSVWGSDVYDFPRKSFLHRFLLKRNLKKADAILSTSYSMAEEIAKYTSTKIDITPFGVDMDVFKPQKVKSLFNEGDIVVGTIKSLETKYGVEFLIEAFDILCKKHVDLPLKLLIVGGGSQEAKLKKMSTTKGIQDKVKFMGRAAIEEVPMYNNMLDVYVALSDSDSESFGVAAIEAAACEKPVVVSNVSGFAEIVENGTTGIIVPRANPKVAANAIEKIILDKELARQMGEKGRERVAERYNWSSNINDIIQIYNSILNK
jgi:glycosyltransferase involved in cell wall biosynthesis